MNTGQEICSFERSALLTEALRIGGRLRLRVYGESMLPALWPGDVAEIEESEVKEARRGDIVLAVRDGRVFLHRFMRHLPRGGFVLRGDSMPKPDPAFASDAFVARLISIEPRKIMFRNLSPRWSRAAGIVFCYCGVARRIGLRLHRRWHTRTDNLDTLAPAS
jgi:hypothetical protein